MREDVVFNFQNIYHCDIDFILDSLKVCSKNFKNNRFRKITLKFYDRMENIQNRIMSVITFIYTVKNTIRLASLQSSLDVRSVLFFDARVENTHVIRLHYQFSKKSL